MGAGDERAWREDVDRVRASVRTLAQGVAQLPNASERASAVGAALEALEQEAAHLQGLRLAAIADLRAAGYSYDRIASLTGLSKARAAQLSRAARKPSGRQQPENRVIRRENRGSGQTD